MRQGKDKMSLEHLVPGKEGSGQRMIGPCQKDTGSGLKGLPQAKFGTI